MRKIRKEAVSIPDLREAIAAHSGDLTEEYENAAGGRNAISWYLPREARTGEWVLLIHGGGWGAHTVFPDQDRWQGDYLGFLGRLLARRGILAASLDYRGLDACADLGELYEDVRLGAEYALGRAGDLGAAGEARVLGESAGGHLAAMLATEAAPRFRRAYLFDPITDLRTGRWSSYAPPALREALSPVCRVSERTAECVLFHGLADRTVDFSNSDSFAAELRRADRPCRLYALEDTDHAFLLAEYTTDLAACTRALELLLAETGVR